MPEILNWVEITALTPPVENRNLSVIGQPLLDGPGSVARRAILHEGGAARHVHAGLEVLLKNPFVHGGVPLWIVLDRIETAQLAVPEGAPDHELWRMLDSADDEVGVVARDGAWPADTVSTLVSLPELNLSLI